MEFPSIRSLRHPRRRSFGDRAAILDGRPDPARRCYPTRSGFCHAIDCCAGPRGMVKRGGTQGLSVCGVRSARRSVRTSSEAPSCRSFVTATGLRPEGYADLLAVKPPDKSGRGLRSRVPGHPPQRRYDGETRGTNHCQSNCTNQHCIPPLRDGQRPSVDVFRRPLAPLNDAFCLRNFITLDFDNFRTIHAKKSLNQTICGASPVFPD